MYRFNKIFEGNIFVTSGKKMILTDKLTQEELAYLYAINHPACMKIKLKKEKDDKNI